MIDLFHHEPDVNIRLLQLHMRISAVNSPAVAFQKNLFVMKIVQNLWANSDIEHLIFVYIKAGL